MSSSRPSNPITKAGSTRPGQYDDPGSVLNVYIFDLVAIIIFALFARFAHDGSSGFDFFRWGDTAWPFLIGTTVSWFVVWFAVLRGRSGYEFIIAVPIWLGTVAIGLIIWGLRNGGVPHWSFILVALLMSAILLFGWRGIAAILEQTKRR